MAEEEVDYESDPEEAKMSLKMRRREASDDEEEEGKNRSEKPMRKIDDFDGESEGGAADYEDDLVEEDYGLDEEFEGEDIEEAEYEAISGGKRGDRMMVAVDRTKSGEGVVRDIQLKNDAGGSNDDGNAGGGGREGEKKEVEPYAVPTSGAFYMHDDRFGSNSGRRNRRMLDGRKLWHSRDNWKWGHDKFEEDYVHERNYGQRRVSRGSFRGRGKNRSADHRYAQGFKPREQAKSGSQNNNIENSAPKGIKGRGTRKYQPSLKNNNELPKPPLAQNKQSRKFVEKPSYVSSVRTNESTSYTEDSAVLSRKQEFASNLSIASPPFYPAGSSKKQNSIPHKREVQVGTTNQNGQPPVADESLTEEESTAMFRGKNKVGSFGVDMLSIDDSGFSVAGKLTNNVNLPVSYSPMINFAQHRIRGEGRGVGITQLAYQPVVSINQVNKDQAPGQQQTPSKNFKQTSAQSSGKQFTRVSSGPQASSSLNSGGLGTGEAESSSESNKSEAALVAEIITSAQSSGRGSFLYGGVHVTVSSGNMGNVHGDKNFPTFLPVMQFGGQHPRGVGVPALGMAFPGYVGQPQLGNGNSEMTWLPVLAGAAGALGAPYSSPYISVDGLYHAHPSGQMPTIIAAASKENNLTTNDNDCKPAQRLVHANDDSVQKQKNSRRYTEMKYDE